MEEVFTKRGIPVIPSIGIPLMSLLRRDRGLTDWIPFAQAIMTFGVSPVSLPGCLKLLMNTFVLTQLM